MVRTQTASRAREFHTGVAGRRIGTLLEIDAWIRSEINAISPLAEPLMRLIGGTHCITGEEDAVELALREALRNAVVHGNRLDARKLVRVRCRYKVGKGISLIVSDDGQGFDVRRVPIPWLSTVMKRSTERGIQLMKLSFVRTGRHSGLRL